MGRTNSPEADDPMLTLVLAALLAWFLLSVPVAVIVGAILGGHSRIRVARSRNRLSLG